MGVGNHLAHRVDGAQHVGDVSHTHQPRVLVEELPVDLELEFAPLVDGDHLQLDFATALQELPRHNIGMVLHDGENHLVAVVQKLVAKRRGHQVDGFGRAPRKDNFGGRSGPDKLLHPAAGRLVGIGSLLAEGMHPAMHVGIHPIVGIGNVVDHAAGGLRGGGVVQIDERTARYLTFQNGEIGSYLLNIQHSGTPFFFSSC